MQEVLCGDLGGTKIRLSVVDSDHRKQSDLRWPSKDFESFETILALFLEKIPQKPRVMCLGVAGPVKGRSCDMVNLSWKLDAGTLERQFGFDRVYLINDLEAIAWGISALGKEQLCELQTGRKQSGNAVLIAAGTGLGQAGLYWDGREHLPFASEGGHCNFAPSTQRDAKLWAFLAAQFGHCSWERVLSGNGLVNLYRFLNDQEKMPTDVTEVSAACISQEALTGSGETSKEALRWFCYLYGVEAGNLALKILSPAGVYIGGGIAPKILPALKDGRFLDGFLNKGRFSSLLSTYPIYVILEEAVPLLGAWAYATRACRAS